MEEELQQLREQLSQLKAANERLRWDRASAQAGPSRTNQVGATPTRIASLQSAPSTERVVVMSRERKCSLFNGKCCSPLGTEDKISCLFHEGSLFRSHTVHSSTAPLSNPCLAAVCS